MIFTWNKKEKNMIILMIYIYLVEVSWIRPVNCDIVVYKVFLQHYIYFMTMYPSTTRTFYWNKVKAAYTSRGGANQ